MKVIIDRFDGNYAVCECEYNAMINVEKKRIPSSASEGSILNIDGDNVFFDEEDNKLRHEQIKNMMDSLWDHLSNYPFK